MDKHNHIFGHHLLMHTTVLPFHFLFLWSFKMLGFNTVLYPIWDISKELQISCNNVYYSLKRVPQTGSSHNRKTSGRSQRTNEWKDKCIWVSSLRNRCLTGSHLAALLNGTSRTRVSPSNIKRRLQDAGLKDWVKRKSSNWDWPIKWKD